MFKIERLNSAEQEQLLCVVRDEWLRLVFDNPGLDREKAEKSIRWLYRLAKLRQPIVIFLDSPLACQIAATVVNGLVESRVEQQGRIKSAIGLNNRSALGSRTGFERSIENRVESGVRNQVTHQFRDVGIDISIPIAFHVKNEPRRFRILAGLREEVSRRVWYRVWQRVCAQVSYVVSHQAEDLFRNQIWQEVAYEPGCGLLHEARRAACFDYFSRIGVLDFDSFNGYFEYLRAGVFYSILLDGYALVCGRPQFLRLDNEKRLHSADCPAILWEDGYAQYFWHGVSVPDFLIENPESLTREDIIEEGNVEIKRAMLERLGAARVLELLSATVLQEDVICGSKAVLYRSQHPDDLTKQYLNFLKVTCPSTQREYVLCVPPDVKDCWEAVAWTFGRDKKEYLPLVNT